VRGATSATRHIGSRRFVDATSQRIVLNFQAEAEGVTPDKVIAIDKRP
jgi:hypothetical protein